MNPKLRVPLLMLGGVAATFHFLPALVKPDKDTKTDTDKSE